MPAERVQPRLTDLPEMSAETISERRFGQSWRGYDQDEVRQFLSQVAEQVRSLRERYDKAEAARREAEERAAHPRLDEATLMSALGEETAAILHSAHSAAAEVVAKAEASAERSLAEARSKANELLAHAESVLAERVAEAEAAAAQVLEQAGQQASAVAQEAARNHDELLRSAEAQRDKVLADLARRRKLATVQIEQLRAGRERLLSAYLRVRETLDEVTDELQRADTEARAASEAVGHQHAAELEEMGVTQVSDVWGARDQPAQVASAVVLAPKAVQVHQEEGTRGHVATGAQARGANGVRTQPDSYGRADLGGLAPSSGGDRGASGPSQHEAVVAPAAVFESVRIVRTEEPPTEETAAEEAPAPDVVTAGETATEETATEETAAEEAPAPDVVTAEETATEERAPEEAPALLAEEAPAPLEESAGASAPAFGTSMGAATPPDVESLFARIRAGRAEATAKARKTLEANGVRGTPQTPTGPEHVAEAPALQVGTDLRAPGTSQSAEEPVTSPHGVPPTLDEDALSDTEHEFFIKRDEVATRLESSLARKLKRALQDEQNALLDRLRNLKGPLTPSNVLPSAEEHPDRFIDVGRPLLEDAAKGGADLATMLYGTTANGRAASRAEVGPEVVEDLAEELGRAIADPLRQRLEEALRSSGTEPGDIADALGAAYREWKTQRIEAAAHDEVAAAFSRGTYLAFAEGTLLHWVIDDRKGPCPDCEDNTLAGAQRKGEPWPTGQLYPPAHPGCRCALAPVNPEPPSNGARAPSPTP